MNNPTHNDPEWKQFHTEGAEMETKVHISEEIDAAAVKAASKKWLARAPQIRDAFHAEQDSESPLEVLQPLQGLQAL